MNKQYPAWQHSPDDYFGNFSYESLSWSEKGLYRHLQDLMWKHSVEQNFLPNTPEKIRTHLKVDENSWNNVMTMFLISDDKITCTILTKRKKALQSIGEKNRQNVTKRWVVSDTSPIPNLYQTDTVVSESAFILEDLQESDKGEGLNKQLSNTVVSTLKIPQGLDLRRGDNRGKNSKHKIKSLDKSKNKSLELDKRITLTLTAEKKLDDKTKSEHFQASWAYYPRKDGKLRAFNAFNSSIKTLGDIMDFRKAYRNYINWLTAKGAIDSSQRPVSIEEEKYIKHGGTFYGSWSDWTDKVILPPTSTTKSPSEMLRERLRASEDTIIRKGE